MSGKHGVNFPCMFDFGFSNWSQLSVHESHYTCGMGDSFYFSFFNKFLELSFNEDVWDMKANLK